MFKGNRKYYWILGGVFVLIVTVQYLQPKPVNWVRTYMSKDKIPYGCYAIYQLLENSFADKVSVNHQNLYYLNDGIPKEKRSFILVNDRVEFEKIETGQLIEFAEGGNTVLLCANNFFGHIKDTFKLETESIWPNMYGPIDSILKKPSFTLKYVQRNNNLNKKYTYTEAAAQSFFTSFDTSAFKVVSTDEKDRPVLLSRKTGAGVIYLASIPDVFTNLFIVNEQNRFYAYTLLSYAKNHEIVWDEYYKTYNVQHDSVLKFIFGSDALYSAYCLLILSLIFFMIFSSNRRQKPIPVITPLENSTLQFVDVVGNVYFNANNHKYIALEKIVYFYYEIRTKFHLNTNEINDQFFDALSRLSGLTFQQVKELFMYCENLKRAPGLGEADLIELNERINIFKQKSIR